jgi:hypothetical protein
MVCGRVNGLTEGFPALAFNVSRVGRCHENRSFPSAEELRVPPAFLPAKITSTPDKPEAPHRQSD